MRTPFLAAISLAVLCGCASQPRPAQERLPDPQRIQTTFYNRLSPPLSGTFTVSYAPRNFAEPADLRAARDQYITARIVTQLTEAGMAYKNMKDPGWMEVDYEVSYSYSTQPSYWPAPEGGFDHSFSIDIEKNPMGPLWHGTVPEPLPKDTARATSMATVLMDPDRTQWSGEADIRFYRDHDISEVFSTLIHALLDDFPKNDSQASKGL
jgi:hypothetical protein